MIKVCRLFSMATSRDKTLPPCDETVVAATSAMSSQNASHCHVSNHTEMIEACSKRRLSKVLFLLQHADYDAEKKRLLAAQQDQTTGLSPLMLAATHGYIDICQALLQAGAPWNAVDRCGKCAGNYATDNEHWEVVNLLVDYGTRAELILGASIRLAKNLKGGNPSVSGESIRKLHREDSDVQRQVQNVDQKSAPVSHEPCTKPDYLQHDIRYNAANTLLLDKDDDAVMMAWERPIMKAHASLLTDNGSHGKRILNIGFGLGIIDEALQNYKPSSHVIIEAHPQVYRKMCEDGWNVKENVRICFGRWQDELPKLIQEGCIFDGIFYDTYGEHFTDLEDFHGEFVLRSMPMFMARSFFII